MSVSALSEITVGVRDLHLRTRQFQTGCGLTVLASGPMDPVTANRLFDLHTAPLVAVLGRTDVPGSPQLRLVAVSNSPSVRSPAIDSPGPLALGFTTLGISEVHERLRMTGIRFVSAPIRVERADAATVFGRQRFESFGQTEDGDFVALSERLNESEAYGTFGTDCSEPLFVSFVVTNLDASLHFMRDVLRQEVLAEGTCAGSPFDAILGLPPSVSFRVAMTHKAEKPTGQVVFWQFETRREPMAQTPGLTRGISRLRYDTTDLHETLNRVPGGGGSLVRGPASVDDPILGRGLIALVRSPFGVVIELWQKG